MEFSGLFQWHPNIKVKKGQDLFCDIQYFDFLHLSPSLHGMRILDLGLPWVFYNCFKELEALGTLQGNEAQGGICP